LFVLHCQRNGSATVNMAKPSSSRDRSLWGREAEGRREAKADFDRNVFHRTYVNQHLEDGERDWCADRNLRGSVTEQRSLAIIFRSGGVVLGGLFESASGLFRQYVTGHDCPRIFLRSEVAKSSRSRAKRSWCALKFAMRCRIWSRSELLGVTGDIRCSSMTARGMSGSTPALFVSLMVSCISASSSACQLVILVIPKPSAYRTRPGAAMVASRLGGHCGKPMYLQFLRNVRQRRFKILKIRVWRRRVIYQVAKFIDPCKVHTVHRIRFTAGARVRSRDAMPSGVAQQLCVLSV
jgi:hypothetical protein